MPKLTFPWTRERVDNVVILPIRVPDWVNQIETPTAEPMILGPEKFIVQIMPPPGNLGAGHWVFESQWATAFMAQQRVELLRGNGREVRVVEIKLAA